VTPLGDETAVPSSPASYYVHLRGEGESHEEARRLVAHAYQRTEREIDAIVRDARARFEEGLQ
jgi:hypothetical protein